MITKELLLFSQHALTKTSIACLVGASLIGCGGGGDSAPSSDNPDATALIRGLSESPRLVLVERDAQQNQAAATEAAAAAQVMSTLLAGQKFSPYAVNRGAKLIIRSSLDVEADQADLLLDNFGWTDYDAKDISVSADGSKILFAAIGPAGSAGGETWNIYEYDPAAQTLRRVISNDAIANAGNDTSPAYGPNGEIVFSSDRSSAPLHRTGGTFQQDGQTCYAVPQGEKGGVLHMMSAAGENIEALTSGLHFDVEPTLMADGQIAFVRISDHYELTPTCSVDGGVVASPECADTMIAPVGAVTPGVKIQLMRIDLNDRRADLLYEPVILLGDDAEFELDKITQSDNGNFMALVRHSHLVQAGGTILTFGAPQSGDTAQPFGGFAPTPLIQPLNEVVPGALSLRGWISAYAPAYDGTGRIVKSWAQCVLNANGVDSFCDANTDPFDPNIQTNYGIWFYDQNADSSVPLLTELGKHYSDLALMLAQQPAAWPHAPFMSDYPLVTHEHTVVCDGNTPPVANAGPDQEVQQGTTALLSGAGSYDLEDDLLTYNWRVVRQPEGSAVALSDASAISPTFAPVTLGEYEFELIVSDGEANSQPDSVIITAVDYPVEQPDPYSPEVNNPNNEPRIKDPNIVNNPEVVGNRAPTANAGPDQAAVLAQVITLDGSASADPDGDAITYAWQLVEAPVEAQVTLNDAQTARPNFTVTVAGNYIFSLTVNDGRLNSSPDTVLVSTENLPPIADAGDDAEILIGESLQLNGAESYDPEGAPITYSWTIASGPEGLTALADATTFQPTLTGSVPGVYLIDLIVNDGELNSQPDQVKVTVKEIEGNQRPIADAGDEQYSPLNQQVTLDGTGSSDPEGSPLSYRWMLMPPAGSAAQLVGPMTAQPQFIPDVPGTYVAQLIVNDGQLDSLPDTVAVSTMNAKPIADAGDDIVTMLKEIQLDGTGSRDDDGDPLTYSWWITSMPEGQMPVLVGADTARPTLTVDSLGQYIISLQVNDGQIDSDVDEVKVQRVTQKVVCEDDQKRQDPKLYVTPDQKHIWPPNHKMVCINMMVHMTDACGNQVPADAVSLKLISVTSSQPDNGTGDGNTVDDIQGADIGTDDRNFCVRAERAGGDKAGRTYTAVYEVVDAAGNVTQTETKIYVKHDQSKKSDNDD